MPKRKIQDRIDRYRNKIRILESKSNRRRIVSPIIDSSSDESERANEELQNAVLDVDLTVQESASPEAEQTILPELVAETHTEHENIPAMTNDAAPAATSEVPPGPETEPPPVPETEPDLDPELLSALGESTSDGPDFGEKIHENLAKLWLPLLKKGMPKETKEKIIKDYLIPDNCRLLQAPKLNAEISAAVPDMVRNRDKNLTTSQQQLGSGVTAINRGMDLLLKTDEKIQALKHISNGCRILADLHFTNTQSRIKLLTPSLDKTFLHVIQDAERDETLFGNKLSDKIKAAKAIEKQGLQIKKVFKTQKPSTPAQPTGSRPAYQGNWTAPPPPRYPYPSYRGGRGGARKPAPAARRPYTMTQAKTSFPDKTRAPAHQ